MSNFASKYAKHALLILLLSVLAINRRLGLLVQLILLGAILYSLLRAFKLNRSLKAKIDRFIASEHDEITPVGPAPVGYLHTA